MRRMAIETKGSVRGQTSTGADCRWINTRVIFKFYFIKESFGILIRKVIIVFVLKTKITRAPKL